MEKLYFASNLRDNSSLNPEINFKYGIATEIINQFMVGTLAPAALNKLNFLNISKITLLDNIAPNDITLPSYKMSKVIVYTLSMDGVVNSWTIDMNLVKQLGRTPESYIVGLLMASTFKVMLITESATRRDDNRLILITLKKPKQGY